jgi:hypothetical protein
VLISNRVFFYPVQGDNYYDMHVFLSCLQKSKGAGTHRPEATERRQIFYLQNLRRRWGIWSCRQEPGRGKIWTHRWGSRARSRTDAAGATDDSVDLVWVPWATRALRATCAGEDGRGPGKDGRCGRPGALGVDGLRRARLTTDRGAPPGQDLAAG